MRDVYIAPADFAKRLSRTGKKGRCDVIVTFGCESLWNTNWAGGFAGSYDRMAARFLRLAHCVFCAEEKMSGRRGIGLAVLAICAATAIYFGAGCGAGAKKMNGQSSQARQVRDRKSTRLNSSHPSISYAVFCLKKKKNIQSQKKDQDEEQLRAR